VYFARAYACRAAGRLSILGLDTKEQAMLDFETPVVLELEDGEMLRWRQAAALQLQVLDGRVWVTRLGDPDDHFLGRGDTMRVDRSTKVIAGAEGRARVRLSAPSSVPAAGLAATLRTRLAQWLAWPVTRTG